MAASLDLHAVAIAGGSGTRFWPLSRQARPKQLLRLGGEQTLLAATFHRMQALVAPSRWWMVVGRSHADGCREAVPQVPHDQVLVESQARNTAPAIALAATHLAARHPDAIMVVLPADHHVADTASFCAAIEVAARAAHQGRIMTLGVEPTHPETGFGYLERGEPIEVSGAFVLTRFVEKPDAKKAEALLAKKNFLWNAGIFVMRADTFLQQLDRHLPELGTAMQTLKKTIGTASYDDTLQKVFASAPNISIDYGVMEKVDEAGVVPASCGWSDVGSWNALGSVVAADAQGNVVAGQAVLQDSHNCVAYATEGHVVALVGLDDLVVVHTEDATLVLPKSRSQDVRNVLQAVKDRQWNEVL